MVEVASSICQLLSKRTFHCEKKEKKAARETPPDRRRERGRGGGPGILGALGRSGGSRQTGTFVFREGPLKRIMKKINNNNKEVRQSKAASGRPLSTGVSRGH